MDRRDEAHRRTSRPVNTHGGLRMLFLFGFQYFNVAFSIYVSTRFSFAYAKHNVNDRYLFIPKCCQGMSIIKLPGDPE